MPSLSKLIEITRKTLAWRVIEETRDSADFEIVSDPWLQVHTLYWPAMGDRPREIEHLHELAHAHLAEKMNPLLATAHFRRGIRTDAILPLIWPQRCAADWLADALLRSWAQREVDKEIIEHLRYASDLQKAAVADNSVRYGCALIIAQALLWHVKPIVAPPIYGPLVDILLSYPPTPPSLPKMAGLLNRLAAVTTNLRVSLALEDGITVWDLSEQ